MVEQYSEDDETTLWTEDSLVSPIEAALRCVAHEARW